MPRYRFRWENIEPTLLEALCPEEDSADDRVAWLRANYGARPRADFVADTWPVLRDHWVLARPERRDAVVAALRAAGLGRSDLAVESSDECAAYLQSCRNATTLRSIVLDELIRSGEGPAASVKPVSREWPPFETALTATLAGLAEDQFLILTIKQTGSEESAPRFVQFAAQGRYGMRAEGVSNEYLGGVDRLEPTQIEALLAAGWSAPTSVAGDTPEDDPDGSPNFWREWQVPVPYGEVARVAVAALREVYGAPHPGFLVVEAHDAEGSVVAVPALQGASPADVPAVDERAAAPLLVRPSDPDELRRAVHASLATLLQTDDLVVDDDGDIPIRWGSAALYVRVLDELPVIRIFSPVVSGIAITPQVREAVNEVNRDRLLVNALWTDDSVVVAADLYAATFSEDNFVNVVHALAEAADEIDDVFAARFVDPSAGRPGYGGYL